MKAVQVCEFSAVERVDTPGDNESTGANRNGAKKRKIAFRPRPQPLSLSQVLSLVDVPTPSQNLRPDQVLIEVHYVGVQYPDALQAMGLYQVRPSLPYIPCMDVSGIVLAVGSGTFQSKIVPGQRVLATLLKDGGTGGMAQQVVAPSSWVYPVPSQIRDMSRVANIGRNYFAAYHSLKTIGKVRKGSLILVDGASGGVGMATIQLAKAMGCQVIAGVSQSSKMDPPQQAGADVVLSYGKTKPTYMEFKKQVKDSCQRLGHPGGVDLVVDMVQGNLFETALISCARPLGTIALVGFTAGQKPIRPGLLLIKEVNVVGSLWGRWAHEFPDLHRKNVHEILQLLQHHLRPADRIFAMHDYHQAFELFETNQGRGNTVVSMRDARGDTGDATTWRSML